MDKYTIYGNTFAVCGRTLFIMLGHNSVKSLEIKFPTVEDAWSFYCKPLKLTIEPCTEEEIEQNFTTNEEENLRELSMVRGIFIVNH
jgi:hypothetical protein